MHKSSIWFFQWMCQMEFFLKFSTILFSVINLPAVCSSESLFYAQVYLHSVFITAIRTNVLQSVWLQLPRRSNLSTFMTIETVTKVVVVPELVNLQRCHIYFTYYNVYRALSKKYLLPTCLAAVQEYPSVHTSFHFPPLF